MHGKNGEIDTNHGSQIRNNMNTNAIPYWDTVIKINEHLAGAPAGILVFLLCIALGYVWKNMHFLPNRFIPGIVMLFGAVANPLLYWPANAKDAVRLTVVGLIIGFIAWLFHRLVLKKIEEKFGIKLEDNTEFFEKPKQNNEKTDNNT